MSTAHEVKKELEQYTESKNVDKLKRFFKTGKGEYGEGDIFIGVKVPHQRIVARKYKNLPLKEIETLLNEDIHEYRLTALFILVYQYEKSDQSNRAKIVDLYMHTIERINNWDLVDSSAHKILGHYFYEKDDPSILYLLAKEDHLWKQRIAIISTYHFIKMKSYDPTLRIATILLNHKHDLIHKAVGWMLREVGNRDLHIERMFLDTYAPSMPRTMLRYAIEKFDDRERKKYLNIKK